MIVELVLLFLMATAALPDEPLPNDDLATFYDENARSIWNCITPTSSGRLLSYFG
jgi:hypothetical protein